MVTKFGNCIDTFLKPALLNNQFFVSSIRVLIFDDNDPMRDSINMLLNNNSEFNLCGSFSNCQNIINDIETCNPDVIIMDINIPVINGIDAVKQIREKYQTLKILMFTVFDNDEKIFAAIKAGASGYILKSSQPNQLLTAIHEVYNGGAPMTPGIAKKVLNQFKSIMPDELKKDYDLSLREKDVLNLLVEGFSYKMIALKLNITYDTVRAHMKKIYEKLHVTSMTEAVAKAINQKIFAT